MRLTRVRGAVIGTILSVSAIGALWAYVRVQENLTGFCRAEGRVLTIAEKKEKLAARFKRPEITDGLIRHTSRQSINRVIKTSKGAFYIDGKPTIHIYPDIPQYTKGIFDRRDNYDVRTVGQLYGAYDGFFNWRPVSSYYKATGYAFDLVFINMRIEIKGSKNSRGVPYILNLDRRMWINSCGEKVSLPEEYEVG